MYSPVRRSKRLGRDRLDPDSPCDPMREPVDERVEDHRDERPAPATRRSVSIRFTDHPGPGWFRERPGR